MDETEVKAIIEQLKPSGLISPDCTKEDLCHKLFEDNCYRKEILKWIISQYSEKYSADFENSEDVNNELVMKLMALGFVEHSTKWLFIKGQMEKEEQMKIYKKIFRTLELLKPHHQTKLLEKVKGGMSPVLEEFTFDKTLEHEGLNFRVLPPTKVEIDSLMTAVNSALSSIQLHPSSGEPSPIRLDEAIVGELHASIQAINKVISPSESVTDRVVDGKKTARSIEDFKKKSLIF